MKWNEALRRILAGVDARVDSLVAPMREINRPIAVPYRGYGTPRKVWIRGRVIDDPGVVDSPESRPLFGHAREMWRRFASREVPGARVEISVGSEKQEAVTDGEGYFDLSIEVELQDDAMWHPYQVRLIDPAPVEDAAFEGSVLVPPRTSHLGIISDIDDTVIDSSATDRLRMLRTLMFTASESRVPFDGIAELFQTLLDSDRARNPVFYVSSSPWNLYDFLLAVLELHGLPPGPMMLQDFGFDADKLIHPPHDEHKLKQISRIIATYPDLQWILVGDSGQRDPEIYKAIADEVPELIRAIIIRDVTTRERDAEVKEMFAPLASSLPVALVQTAEDARDILERAELLESLESGPE